MTPPIKFGICGLGRIGVRHCCHFAATPEHYKPVAFCDLEFDRTREAAEKYGGSAYSDFTEFLSNTEMELVIIATRSLDHAHNAKEALAAGKIVLLEKPIGVTADDYKLLQQLVQDYPGQLYCLHNHRFEPAFENTCSILSEKILGNIQVVKLCKHHAFVRRNDWQMRLDCGGGQLSVWAPHLLDQGLQLLGAPVREVWSYLRRVLTPGDADDHVRILLEGENDVVVELEISNSMALPAPYCAIYGDRGTLIYDQKQREIQLKYLDPEFRWPDASASEGTPELTPGAYGKLDLPWIEETRPVEPDTNMWEYVETEIARHLYQAIRCGVPFPVTNEHALEIVRITEVVKEQNPQFNWIG